MNSESVGQHVSNMLEFLHFADRQGSSVPSRFQENFEILNSLLQEGSEVGVRFQVFKEDPCTHGERGSTCSSRGKLWLTVYRAHTSGGRDNLIFRVTR